MKMKTKIKLSRKFNNKSMNVACAATGFIGLLLTVYAIMHKMYWNAILMNTECKGIFAFVKRRTITNLVNSKTMYDDTIMGYGLLWITVAIILFALYYTNKKWNWVSKLKKSKKKETKEIKKLKA